MAEPSSAVIRRQRRAEFLLLYIVSPVAIAVLLPPHWMFAALFTFTGVGLTLLWLTGGFKWHRLYTGRRGMDFLTVLGFGAAAGVGGWLIMTLSRPEEILALTPERLKFLGMLWLLYPLASALPQELIFRVLFYHRYGALFETSRAKIFVNAAVFSLAHLMYWSITVLVMTWIGGLFMAWAYQKRGFPMAWAMHSLAGNLLFTVGMGSYFWSGAVVRPF